MNKRDLKQIEEAVIEEGWGNRIFGAVAIFTAVLPFLLALAPSVLGWLDRRKVKKIVKEMGQEMVDFLIESIQLDAEFVGLTEVYETYEGHTFQGVAVLIPVDMVELTDSMLDVLGKDREKVDIKAFHRKVVDKAFVKLVNERDFHEAAYDAVLEAHGKEIAKEAKKLFKAAKENFGEFLKMNPQATGDADDWILTYEQAQKATSKAAVTLAKGGTRERKIVVDLFFPVYTGTVDLGKGSMFRETFDEKHIEVIVEKALEIDSYYRSDSSEEIIELSESVLEDSVDCGEIDLTDMDAIEESIKELRFQSKMRYIWTEESEAQYKNMMESISIIRGDDVLLEADLASSISSGDLVTHLDLTADEANQAIEIMKSAGRRDSAEMAMRKIDFIIHERDPEDAENRRKADNVQSIRHKLLDDNGYWGDTVALYVNTGDVYNPTIVYNVRDRQFILTDVGTFKEELDAGLAEKAFERTFEEGIEAGVEASILTTKPFDLSEVRKVMRRNQKCGPLVLRVDDFEKVDISDGEVALEVKGSLEHKMTRDLQNRVYRSSALNSEYDFREFKAELTDSMKSGLEQCLRESAKVQVSDVAIHEFDLWLQLQVESSPQQGDPLVEALVKTSPLQEQSKMPLKPEVRDRVPTPFDPFILPRSDNDQKLWFFHDGQFLYGSFKTKAQALDAIHNGHVEPFEINQFDGQ